MTSLLLLLILTFFTTITAKSISVLPETNKRKVPPEELPNGSPGIMCYADTYNKLGNSWNRTYTSTEPQQIHISLTDDARYARVQFATLGKIRYSLLQYWPKRTSNHHHLFDDRTLIKGEVYKDYIPSFFPYTY